MTNNRIQSLKQILTNENIDAFIINSSDMFQSEFLPDCNKRLEWLTNFTGSNGIAIITNNNDYFLTDGRYTLQAKNQLNNNFQIYNLAEHSLKSILEKINSKQKLTFAFDGNIMTKLWFERNVSKNYNLISKENLVDKIWQDRPSLPQSDIFILDHKFTGKDIQQKIVEFTNNLRENQAEIICEPSLICWLLNLRASDVEYNPFLLCYAIVTKEKQIFLFSDNKNLNADIKEYFSNNNISIYGLHEIYEIITKLQNKNYIFVTDENYISYNLVEFCNKISYRKCPAILQRACKTDAEINNIKQYHINDGTALTKFIFWLKNHKNIEKLSEKKIVDKILELRSQQDGFLYPSFETIAGFGANGAIIHYNVTKESNQQFSNNNLLLLDSGGQYYGATTDVTRVISFGQPTEEQIRNYTLVLKCHIALARQKFPYGTSGSQLDILARQYLWQNGLDYDHGTGHGVGTFLGVHEGPQNIGKKPNIQTLQTNMLISNEPGYYKQNQYGIRIENLVIVKKSDIKSDKEFYEFETVTLAPLEFDLIDKSLLLADELAWLNEYHNKIVDIIGQHLSKEELEWLKNLNNTMSRN